MEQGVDFDRALSLIDRGELVELVLDLANIDSPPGQEQHVSDRVLEWLGEHELEGRQLGMFPDRQNVIGRVRGDGSGPTLIFNAHMDTAWGPEERRWMHDPDHPVYTSAWLEGDRLYGNGVVNDKGPLACTLLALKAVRDSGVRLRGDVIATGVCGEIGQEPVDEFTAPEYLSKEVGTRYLVEHGVIGDYALVAENTNFGVTTVEAGKAWFKITVLGERALYTPYVPAEQDMARHPNALMRATSVIEWLGAWAKSYEERNLYPFEFGTCVPKVNVGAIRGGQPFIPISTAERCFLYVDVRLTPAQTAMDVEQELGQGLRELGVPFELDCILYRRGYEAVNAEPIIEVLERAHQAEFDGPLGGVSPGQASSWRDTNPFNELGIPAISYGPSAGMGGLRAWTTIDDLVHATRMYCRVALGLCTRGRGGEGG